MRMGWLEHVPWESTSDRVQRASVEHVTIVGNGSPMVPPSARRYTLLVRVMPVATFACLAMLLMLTSHRIWYDERIFLDVAHSITTTGLPIRTYDLQTPKLFFDHTPLYVYALAVVTWFGGDTLTIARTISLVTGAATVGLVFVVGQRIRGQASGFVAAMLVAVNPLFIELSWFVRMEVFLCFFLVLAVYLLEERRFLAAGMAIAVAVMLKEIALAFWAIATLYALIREGWRRVVLLAAPAPIAFVAWLAYAASLDLDQLRFTLGRWLGSATGDFHDPRTKITKLAWAKMMVSDAPGPLMVFAAGAAAPFVLIGRRRIPPIAWVAPAYCVVAVVTSFFISLKEPRYIIGVVPLGAIAIGTLVDWDVVWKRIVRPPSGQIAEAGVLEDAPLASETAQAER